MMIAGAYDRETGQLLGTRPAKNEDGSNAYSTGYMEAEWLLLIYPDVMPERVVVGSTVVTEELEDGAVVERDVPTVNGEVYAAYMVVPNVEEVGHGG